MISALDACMHHHHGFQLKWTQTGCCCWNNVRVRVSWRWPPTVCMLLLLSLVLHVSPFIDLMGIECGPLISSSTLSINIDVKLCIESNGIQTRTDSVEFALSPHSSLLCHAVSFWLNYTWTNKVQANNNVAWQVTFQMGTNTVTTHKPTFVCLSFTAIFSVGCVVSQQLIIDSIIINTFSLLKLTKDSFVNLASLSNLVAHRIAYSDGASLRQITFLLVDQCRKLPQSTKW